MVAWTRNKFRKYPDLKEFVLYALFGVLTVFANIGTFMALRHFDVPTEYANALAWLISVLVAYTTNRLWVFKSTSDKVWKEFGIFFFYRFLTGIFDEIIVVVLVEMTGPPSAVFSDRIWELLVKSGSNVIVILLNYIFSKKRIFK